jgi:cell wall-associated NlpC family hydrolase
MPSGQDIAAAAAGLVGTRWRHQGRLPGIGLDCGGVVVAAGRLAGLECPEEHPDYDGIPSEDRIRASLERFADRVGDALADARPGDVLQLAEGGIACHLAVLVRSSPPEMVHCVAIAPRGVVRVPVDDEQARKIRAVWRYRGTEG